MRQARHTTEIYKEIDNIYLNISFQPPYLSNEPYLLEYNVTKDTPILDRMNDYYLSVIRFDIPLSEIPITIAPPLPNQNPAAGTYPNLLFPVIGISYNGVNYPIGPDNNLVFIPETPSIPPAQNFPFQNITPYYWVFSYNWFLTIINNALLVAYNASPLPGLFPAFTPPYFTYDSVTQLISLIVPDFFTRIIGPAVAIPTISFNFNMLEYLDGFPTTQNAINSPNGFDFTINLSQANVHDINGYALFGTAPTNPPTYFKITQDQVLIQYWNPIKKLLLTSETIPVVKEYVQAQTPFGPNSSLNPSLPIITDFTPVVEKAGDQRTVAFYLPTAEYRKVNMISELPLQKVSLKVYWEDLYGNIYPLHIGAYQSASVKIVFLHKSMYKKN